MNRNYTTDVINLNSYDFSESDKIVLMYSKEKGLLRGIAKGCKKPKSKLGATMQTLVANKVIMNKGRNLDIISQAEARNSFKVIKNDYEKLSLSMYCAEIISNFGIEDDANSNEVYSLLYSGLTAITNSKSDTETLLNVMRFQLKIMDLFGFQINFNSCSNCGEEKTKDKSLKFSISSGGILCQNCYEKAVNIKGRVVSINHKIIDFLQALSLTDFEESTKYDDLVTKKVCVVCFNLLKDYISYHSPKKFKTVEMIELAC